MQDIPHTVSDLTPAWLSARLGRAVAGFHVTTLDGGVMSDTFKLGSITYRDPQGDAPKSVVVKIASSVPELRAFGMSVHIYNKELTVIWPATYRSGRRGFTPAGRTAATKANSSTF